MEALGSQVHVIAVAAANAPGGLLGARIAYAQSLCAADDRHVWLNQYANPGLGTSVRHQQLDESYVDDVVLVEEPDTVRACHRLAGRGFLFGGSTGTVVSGAMSWLDQHDAHGLTAVAIAPDLGERYLDTIYRTDWVQDAYGDELLTPAAASIELQSA